MNVEDVINRILAYPLPQEAPVLAVAAFVIAAPLWWLRGDRVAALVFSFAGLALVFWIQQSWNVVEAYREYGWDVVKTRLPLHVEMAVLIGLFASCVGLSGWALTVRRPFARPEAIVSVLIIAYTAHVHLFYSMIFEAANVPTWATYLLQALH